MKAIRRGPAPKKRRNEALGLAIERAGGVTALAAALGVTKAAVSQWETIPIRHVAVVAKRFRIAREKLLFPHVG